MYLFLAPPPRTPKVPPQGQIVDGKVDGKGSREEKSTKEKHTIKESNKEDTKHFVPPEETMGD